MQIFSSGDFNGCKYFHQEILMDANILMQIFSNPNDFSFLVAKFQVCINIEEVNLVSFESPFFAASSDTKFIHSLQHKACKYTKYRKRSKFQVCINIEEVNLVSFKSPFFAESNDTKFIHSLLYNRYIFDLTHICH